MVAELEKVDFADKSGFTAAYISDPGGMWHFHHEYELILNLKSFGTRIIGDNVELFDRYSMIFVANNIPHSWNHYKHQGGLPDNHGITCHFRREALGDAFLSQYELKPLNDLLAEARRGIAFSETDARLAEPFLHTMVSSTGIDKMVAFFSLMNILCSTEKKRLLCSDDYRHASDTRVNRKMTDVYTYIRENYHRPITLTEVAAVAEMGPFSFSRYFKRNSGAGVVEYINRVRSNRACYLLRETDNPINEIAVECGFQSISNFNKQFRKSNLTTPSEYRSSYR
jgi:AraC-like DNA-binding protein